MYMKSWKENWKIYALFIGLTEAVGALSGFLTRDGMDYFMENVTQPPLSPPGWLCHVVWGLLYALMGFGAARIWISPESKDRHKGLNLYVVQLVMNFFWSLIFFNVRTYGFALLWLGLLWGLVLWMILTFRKVDKPAAWLQLPYLAWLTFAAYLNWGIWMLN
jgi:tryptophan-rich sensory protein